MNDPNAASSGVIESELIALITICIASVLTFSSEKSKSGYRNAAIARQSAAEIVGIWSSNSSGVSTSEFGA